jgi:Ser/Thr protein kinase RdoA (MazF antagonist)
MTPFEPEKVMQEVMKRYGFHELGGYVHIPEAENGLVHKVRFDGKDYMVKKMHRNTTPADLNYINNFTRYMNSRIPEVAVLNVALDGQFYFGEEGAYIVVGDWLPGKKYHHSEPWLIKAVAELMANLHKTSMVWPEGGKRPQMASLEDLDWDRNGMFDRETVTRVLRRDPSPMFETSKPADRPDVEFILSKVDLIFEEYEKTEKWMKNLAGSGRLLTRAVIHGDIYNSNLLWEDQRITGVLDWDCCQYEPLVYELGRVLWEYSKNSDKGTIDPVRSACFLESYLSAGGPVSGDQMDLMLGYIRLLRVTEVLFYVQNAVIGDYWSAPYSAANVRALENLPDKL